LRIPETARAARAVFIFYFHFFHFPAGLMPNRTSDTCVLPKAIYFPAVNIFVRSDKMRISGTAKPPDTARRPPVPGQEP
jgi:hypothetical protein